MQRVTFAVMVAQAILVGRAAPGFAQDRGGNIDLQVFRPAVDSRGFVTVNGADVLPTGDVSFGLVTNWGRGLVKLERDDNRYEVEHVVSPTLTGAVGFHIGPLALEAGASLPFAVVSGDRSPDVPASPDTNERANFRFGEQGVGDFAAHLKWSARSPSSGFGFAILASTLLPTNSHSDRWLGEKRLRPSVHALVEGKWGRLRAAANVGYLYRPSTVEFRDDRSVMVRGIPAPTTDGAVSVGSSIPFGAAVAFSIVPARFEVIGELFGAAPLAGDNYFPLEALAAAKLYLADSSHLSFGAGSGLLRDRGGNPDLRVFLGITFEPRFGQNETARIPDPAVGRRCEDTLIEPVGGCPGADSDGDGIVDSEDWCRDEPEDFDQFEDTDGCPDEDNDHDLIADVDDACPRIDGESLEATQETYNLVDDEDGCPDGRSLIDTETEALVLREIHFEFDSAVIKPESFPILDAVANSLAVHDTIERVEVQGHTDERGARRYNRELSQRRAQSVVVYLTERGIARSRLTPRGYGEEQPVDRRHNEEAWRLNRRVEFVIKSTPP